MKKQLIDVLNEKYGKDYNIEEVIQFKKINSMKTALMELIALLEKDINSGMIFRDELFGYHVAVDMANELLEKEKEHIIDAYCEGFKQGSEGNRIMSEEYYNQIYNQNK